MAGSETKAQARAFVLRWAVKGKRNNKKQVDCVPETGCPSCTGPFRQTEKLKEHLHSLKIYLSRKKGPAFFPSHEKHERKIPEVGTKSWVSFL